MILALNDSGITSFTQFLTVLLIFVGVLFLTYFTTKWVAGYQKGKMMTGNIHVIETLKLTQNKYIQIVNIGDKYFAIAIAKDNISIIGELNEESLVIPEDGSQGEAMDFKKILENCKSFVKK